MSEHPSALLSNPEEEDGFGLHHPHVGRVSLYQISKFEDEFPEHSINWSAAFPEGAIEIVTAETGRAIPS